MQEIGTWTTSEGTISATLVLESEMPDDASGQELPGWVSGALSGALGGAATGAAAGPWGALVGAAAGATIGGVAAATAPPPPKTPPPAGAPSSPPPAPTTAGAPAGATQSNAILALQQFAAAMPALIQLVAASGATAKAGKPSELSDSEGFAEFVSEENLGIDEWTSASEDQGAWTIP
jgi:hypothetical protein